jgi:hypothetical protein
MASEDIEKHLLAGIDDRLRGFSRQVDVESHSTHPPQARQDGPLPEAREDAPLPDRTRPPQARQDGPLPEGGTYRAVLQYEKLLLVSQMCETREIALRDLVVRLHSRGYRQLRSRLSFVGGAYLGNVEAWIEYADPEQAAAPTRGFVQRLGRLWQRFFQA